MYMYPALEFCNIPGIVGSGGFHLVATFTISTAEGKPAVYLKPYHAKNSQFALSSFLISSVS